MGLPPGKKESPESAGLESPVAAYEQHGDPTTWSWPKLFGLGLELLWARPWSWLGQALLFIFLWGIVAPGPFHWYGPPDAIFLGGAFVSALAVVWITIRGHDLLADGPAAGTHPNSPSLIVSLFLIIPLAVVSFTGLYLLASLGNAAMTSYGLKMHAGERLWIDLVLTVIAFRFGAFAIHETVLNNAGPFRAMATSWRLTGSLADGVAFPLALYVVTLTGFWGLIGGSFLLANRFRSTEPFLVIAAVVVGFLILTWGGLVWTAHYVSVKKRSLA